MDKPASPAPAKATPTAPAAKSPNAAELLARRGITGPGNAAAPMASKMVKK